MSKTRPRPPESTQESREPPIEFGVFGKIELVKPDVEALLSDAFRQAVIASDREPAPVLCGGDLLLGLELTGAGRFGNWLDRYRRDLRTGTCSPGGGGAPADSGTGSRGGRSQIRSGGGGRSLTRCPAEVNGK